jgi:enoyl-CoA hydratase
MDIELTHPEPEIALVTINRPARRNALTFSMFRELREMLEHLGRSRDRAVVVTGAGDGFCAGVDLDDAATLVQQSDEEVFAVQELAASLTAVIRALSIPVIAAVNGAAVGAGFALALAADVRVAEPSTRFSAAFIRIGFTGGDMGTSWLLPRIVGMGAASEILLTGGFVESDRAGRMGLVNRVVAAPMLVAEAVAVGRAIAANPPLSVRLTKEALQLNVDAPSLQAAQQLENRNQVLTAGTSDMIEALSAFREGRPPRYGAPPEAESSSEG